MDYTEFMLLQQSIEKITLKAIPEEDVGRIIIQNNKLTISSKLDEKLEKDINDAEITRTI